MQKTLATSEPLGEASVRGREDEFYLSSRRIRIGIFDSGLGGLTVVKALKQVMQNAHIYYIADTINAPYGEKTSEQILQFSLDITEYLIETFQIDVLVLACNTATSFAISHLRVSYPKLIIIGMEPGVKPAIAISQTGKIGILATPATLMGKKYQELIEKLSKEKEVSFFEQACPGLVEQIEKGEIYTDATKILLEKWLQPMKDKNVDTIVLGCTHYPLISTVIEEIMSKNISLIETGKAIANRLLRLATEKGHQNTGLMEIEVYSTGEIHKDFASDILNTHIEIKPITIVYK